MLKHGPIFVHDGIHDPEHLIQLNLWDSQTTTSKGVEPAIQSGITRRLLQPAASREGQRLS
jgi:hypothetical protein